jgi:hypothetical protein
LNGVLAVNAYGLPNQFKPLERNSVQQEMVSQLQSVFEYVGNIPYRRNQTILASRGEPVFYPAEAHSLLSAIDKKSFVVQGQRLFSLTRAPQMPAGDLNLRTESSFATIDLRMRESWQEILRKLNQYGVKISVLGDLLKLIQNEVQCSQLLEVAIDNNDDFTSFVAILAAGESHNQDLDVRWIFDWTLKNKGLLSERVNLMYRQIWLPQLWALVLHPSKKYRSYCFQISQAVQEAK